MPEKARIMIVDDDPNIGRIVSMILRHEGYVVDTAENGTEAISKSEKNFYNLALIDVHLPDMDGTRLLTMLRNTYPRMVKVIMTGFPVLDNALDAINRGVDGYLTKPVSTEKLLKTVREQLLKQDKEKSLVEEKLKEHLASYIKQASIPRQS